MAHSMPEGKDWLAERFTKISPLDVVDLGVGSGTYADLFRPLIGTETYWIGYEIWPEYINQYGLREKYHTILNHDIRTTGAFPYCDLIIAGDVLEHMTKPEALDVIRRMKDAAPDIFIALPIVHYPQGTVDGNPYEAHVHHWTANEMFTALLDGGNGFTDAFYGEVIGVYHWSKDYRGAR